MRKFAHNQPKNKRFNNWVHSNPLWILSGYSRELANIYLYSAWIYHVKVLHFFSEYNPMEQILRIALSVCWMQTALWDSRENGVNLCALNIPGVSCGGILVWSLVSWESHSSLLGHLVCRLTSYSEILNRMKADLHNSIIESDFPLYVCFFVIKKIYLSCPAHEIKNNWGNWA